MKHLYNGIPLPAMPEHEHPNAYIYYSPGLGAISPAKYCLLFTTEPYYGVSSDGKYCIGRQIGDIKYVAFEPITDESTWGSKAESTTQGVENPVGTVVWANFDVLNEDGSVFLKASDPVPVGPVTDRNPAAMLMGFQLGAAIRRMRGMIQPELPPVQTIVGYRYGDSPVLPDINSVWTDKEMYPHAALFRNPEDTEMYGLYLSDFSLLCQTGSNYYISGTKLQAHTCTISANEWVFLAEQTLTTIMNTGGALWANTPFIDDSGNLTEASEPVPVYE